MYSVVIVDDEKNILFDIEIMLKNSGFRYRNIYKAQTGAEAKKIIDKDESVKLVLSDINMPEVSGLKLLEEIRSSKNGIYVIFITGYASFEYAKRAVELGAAGFILKPIKEEELYRCIQKAHRLIKADTELYGKYNVSLIGSILRTVLKTGKCTDEEEKYITDVCGPDKSETLYLAMLGSIPEEERISEHIISGIEAGNFPGCRLYPFRGYEKKELLCLLVISRDAKNVTEIISELYERIKDTEERIYIGISGAASSVTPMMYKECESAFYEKLALGGESIFFYKKRTDDSLSGILSQAQLLEQAMLLNDFLSVEACIKNIFSMYSKERNYLRDIYSLVVKTVMLCQKNTLGDEGTADEAQLDAILKDAKNIGEMTERLLSYVRLNCITEKDVSVNMRDVIDYVDTNYMKELTLDKIGAEFDISPNYLSRKFKKKTGKNFVQYINDKRMERAVEMLESTDMTVVKISELVGFNDQQYFHKLFKRYYGVTPIEFRMEKFKGK